MGFGPRSADARLRRQAPGVCEPSRRGAVVVWTVMFVILLLTILCVVVEIAHLYLARTELENALEAAALAGADHWAKSPTPGNTSASRTVAMQYAAANTIDNKPVILTANGGGTDANQNLLPSGNLIFGAVSFTPLSAADNSYAFDHNMVPSCTVTEVVVADIEITWTVKANDTYGEPSAFEFNYVSFAPAADTLRITKITYGLAGTAGTGLGRFDVNLSPPSPLPTEAIGFATPSGWGPFRDAGSVNISFLPTNSDGTRYRNLEVTPTTPLSPGGTIRFGIDTDMMDGTASPVQNTADKGGNFKTHDFYMVIEFEHDSVNTLTLYGDANGVQGGGNGVQTNLPPGQAQKYSITVTRPGNGTYGVRAQANVLVPPWLKSFLGVPIGPFRVAARTTARAGCSTSPQLVRIGTDGYTQPPAPSP